MLVSPSWQATLNLSLLFFLSVIGVSIQGHCEHKNPFFLEQSAIQYPPPMLDHWLLPNSHGNPSPLWCFTRSLCPCLSTQRQSRSKHCMGVVFLGVPDLVSDVWGPFGGCESLAPSEQWRIGNNHCCAYHFWRICYVPYTVVDALRMLFISNPQKNISTEIIEITWPSFYAWGSWGLGESESLVQSHTPG